MGVLSLYIQIQIDRIRRHRVQAVVTAGGKHKQQGNHAQSSDMQTSV